MKTFIIILKIIAVLILGYSASFGINYLIFGDRQFFSTSNIVAWVIITCVLVYLFVWGDLKAKK